MAEEKKDSVELAGGPVRTENTAEDRAKKYEQYRKMIFAAANQLQFGNLLKTVTPTYTQYTKDNYRTYIQNPSRNEKDIRAMSQFLTRVSAPYRRLLWYFATMYSFYWNLMPKIDLIDPPDEEDLMTAYNEMCHNIDKLEMPIEMTNILYFMLRDGVFYGFLYEDDESIFIHRLNPDYCRPVQLEAGVLNFAFDYSYFKKYPEALESWDSSFQAGYNAYDKDNTNMRWQILDPERTICIKADPDLDEILPFFVGIFEALLDLIDARTLQRNKDVIQNYKLITQKIPFFSDDAAKTTDDFKLEIDTVMKFANQLADSVPEAVGVATTPMEIDTIDFKADDNSSDLNSSSMRQVFDDSGVSQLLFNSSTSGSTGVDSSVKTDAALAFQWVKQIERWVKRFINYRKGNTSFEFEILDVHIWNKDSAVERELKLANSGVPNKMKLAATAGMSPREVMSAQLWENQYLKIHENWIPLQTSYTMSADAGRPSNEDTGNVNDSTSKNKDSGEDAANAIEE